MLFFVLVVSAALTPPDTLTISLEQAVARAVDGSPRISAAQAAGLASAGVRAESRLPFLGPLSLEVERLRRSGDAPLASQDTRLGLRQQVDLSGGSFVRARAAGRRVTANAAVVEDTERLVSAEVRLAYLQAALAQRRRGVLDSAAGYADRLAVISQRRLEAGEGTQLESNAAMLEAARQRSAADRAAAAEAAATADLQRLLNLGWEVPVQLEGLPLLPTGPAADHRRLITEAMVRRPDLGVATELLDAAYLDRTAAARDRVPKLTVGWDWGTEAVTTRLTGFSLALQVPLFQRNQGAIGQAAANAGLATAELDDVRRRIPAEVLEAAARFEQALVAERRIASDVLRAAEENVALSQRALEEGALAITEVIVIRSVALAARLEYLDVLQDAYAAWFRLAATVAVTPSDIARLQEGETP